MRAALTVRASAGRRLLKMLKNGRQCHWALTFLDDNLLPSTSNAVERGNRRHRKMQKAVYRVRTQEHIHDRIALDMLRDSQKEGRTETIKVLHKARAA